MAFQAEKPTFQLKNTFPGTSPSLFPLRMSNCFHQGWKGTVFSQCSRTLVKSRLFRKMVFAPHFRQSSWIPSQVSAVFSFPHKKDASQWRCTSFVIEIAADKFCPRFLYGSVLFSSVPFTTVKNLSFLSTKPARNSEKLNRFQLSETKTKKQAISLNR